MSPATCQQRDIFSSLHLKKKKISLGFSSAEMVLFILMGVPF